MVQPFKYQDPIQVSRIHMKKMGIIVHVYNARNRKVKTGGFLGLTGQADLMGEFQTKGRWCS